jgi:hypothetical protein
LKRTEEAQQFLPIIGAASAGKNLCAGHAAKGHGTRAEQLVQLRVFGPQKTDQYSGIDQDHGM